MPWDLLQRVRRVFGVLLGVVRWLLRRVHRVFLLRELLFQWLLGVFGRLRPGLRLMLRLSLLGLRFVYRLR